MTLTPRELAALRYYQQGMEMNGSLPLQDVGALRLSCVGRGRS